jgi:hypothetical protein
MEYQEGKEAKRGILKKVALVKSGSLFNFSNHSYQLLNENNNNISIERRLM